MKTVIEIIENTTMFQEMTSLLNSSVATEDFVFFDIETTGFDSHNDSVYLIGVLILNDSHLQLIRYFSEFYEDEKNILKAFTDIIKKHKAVVHYNGTHFDIPFITTRFSRYFKDVPFEGIINIDLFECFKKYRDYLKLISIRQVMIEQYCSYTRKNVPNGEELTDYYLKYLALAGTNIKRSIIDDLNNKRPGIKDMIGEYSTIDSSGLPVLGELDINSVFDILFQNNMENIYGLLECGKLLYLIGFLEGNYDFSIFQNEQYINIDIKFYDSIFNSFLRKKFNCEEDVLTLLLPLERMRLKLFYDNYRDYYYIPSQDIAIHKSLSGFYDKSIRQKAAKNNCYNYCIGSFVKGAPGFYEEIKLLGFKVFKADYFDNAYYLDVNVFFSSEKTQIKKILFYYLVSLL